MIPPKLKPGDEVRIVAPSRSMTFISENTRELARQRLEELGLVVSFGKNFPDYYLGIANVLTA